MIILVTMASCHIALEKAIINYSCIFQGSHVDRQDEVIVNILLDKGPLESDGTQCTTKKEVRSFESANCVFDTVIFVSRLLVADVI